MFRLLELHSDWRRELTSEMVSVTPKREAYLCKASDMIAYNIQSRPAEDVDSAISFRRSHQDVSELDTHNTKSGVKWRRRKSIVAGWLG